MLRRFGSLALGLSAMALLGCSGPSPAGESVRETSQPIVNGVSDATSADDAMVAVIWEGGDELTECTGTVIAISGQDLYVLTAGHCCAPATPPQNILRGPRYDQPTAVYPVLQYLANPQYVQGGDASQPFDFCMITAGLGGQAAPPVVPAMTPTTDNVTTATPITQVGYGQTVAGPEGSDNNVFRNEIGPIHVQQFYQYQITYDETAGGTCFGDSGGPDLAIGSDGLREVFGVHSFVEGNCNMLSGSGRVSTVYESFIVPYLNGTPPTEDCDQCQAAAETGACGAQDQACGSNSECVAYSNCLQGCGGTASCVQSCSAQHPNGTADYSALVSCICDTACPTLCASVCGSSSGTSTGSLMLTSSSASASGSGGSDQGAGGSNAGGANGNAGGAKDADNAGNDGGCSVSSSGQSGTSLGLVLAIFGLALGRRRSKGRAERLNASRPRSARAPR